MNYFRVLEKHYSHCEWQIDASYESLIWYSSEPKPTQDELKTLWLSMEMDYVREQRDALLMCSDFRVVPDYPKREAWLVYRQQLRDFPNVWVPDMPFPTPP